MIALGTQLVVLGIAAFTMLVLSVAFARRPLPLIHLLLGTYFWSLTFPMPTTSVAGVGLSPVDAANMLAFGTAVIRARSARGSRLALVGFTLMVMFAIVSAVARFQGDALLGFRAELYVAVPALLVAMLAADDVPRVLTAVWRFGLAMGVVAIVRWGMLALGFASFVWDVSTAGYAIDRVVNAPSTLWIAFAAAIGSSRLLGRGTLWAFGFILPVATGVLWLVVLFAQHRSVWATSAVMLAVVMLGSRGKLRTKALLVAALLAVAVSVEAFELGRSSVVAQSFEYAVSNLGTWEWRIERWQAVWETHAERGPFAIVFGSGYGYSWVSGQVGGEWEVSPHNGFLQIAVRVGLVGAMLLFGTYLHVVARLRGASSPDALPMAAMLVGSLVYFLPYAPTPLTGIILGAGVALVRGAATDASVATTEPVRDGRRVHALVPGTHR